MDALLSVDLGTTGCKAALFSTDGRVLGSHYVEYPLIHCGPGCVEQDASAWWALSVESIRAAIAGSRVSPDAVRAIGVSTQGISFVPVDRSGVILRNAICWLDSRATVEAATVEEEVGDARLFELTGKRPGAAYVLPKLLWLRAHEPDLYYAAHKFLMAHDFLLYRMCGATITDYSMAGGSMLLDVHALEWSEELLSRFAIEPEKLPELAWAGTVAGDLGREAAAEMWMPAGIPVVVGGQDQKCAALGVAIRAGVATVSLGTASAISCLSEQPLLDPDRRIPTFPFVIPGFWDLEGVVGTAGAALKWARDTLFPQETYGSLDRLAAQAPAGANGVRFHPYMEGAASPWWRVAARGSFTGLSLGTIPADLVRSVLEGVAFEVRANLDILDTLTGVEELILFGGGARSGLWASIIANVANRPVRVARTVDVANWGACVLAGLGAGLFTDHGSEWASDTLETPVVPETELARQYSELFQEYAQRGLRLMEGGLDGEPNRRA